MDPRTGRDPLPVRTFVKSLSVRKAWRRGQHLAIQALRYFWSSGWFSTICL
jgi:hypothetical protein